MSDVHLLPCPFCGAGKTEVRENDRPWLGTRYGEPVSISVRHWCEPVVGQPSRVIERVGRDLSSAVAAWNRRAALCAACAPDTIRELLAERDQLAAALEAAREDAERWRALREMDGGEIYALLGDCDGIHPEHADATIDQARGKEVQS